MARNFELIWGGDVNLGRRQHHRTGSLGFDKVLDLPRLRAADLRIFNLECVVSLKGEQGRDKGEGGPYYFRARPEMIAILERAGCDVVACANNHSGDYGPAALMDQRAWLEAAGIGAVGIGATREEAFRPVFRRVRDRVIAIFGVDSTQASFAAAPGRPGNAFLRLSDAAAWTEAFTPLIRQARGIADHVVVAVHWGANGAEVPSAAEVEVGHRLIEAGADAVLGASAHKLQGIEIHQGRPIIHDAGNLLFDSMNDQMRPSDGGLFALDFGPSGVERVSFIPLSVGYGQTVEREGMAAIQASRAYGERCAAMGTDLEVDADGHGHVRLHPPDAVPARALPDGLVVEHVPIDAMIEPIAVGPLRLLGLRVGPRVMTRRQILWVESFWDCTEALDGDWRIGFLAVPTATSAMPEWGRGMDHDPCDWRLPTRRWQPGQIHRDLYGLRPPPIQQMENVELSLNVRLIGPEGERVRARLPHVALPTLPEKAIPRFSKADPGYRIAPLAPVARETAVQGHTWTAAEIAEVTGGRWIVAPPDGWHVRSVVNSAKHIAMRPGPHLYVAHDSWDRMRHERATPARNVDRHLQVPQLQDRIAGAVVSRPMGEELGHLPQLLVQDPIRAMIELGLAARQRFTGEVFGVTGTVGKSSLCAMLHRMLGGPEVALASIDNYNSRVGAPVQLASLGPDYHAAIVEMAQSSLWMRHGPISRLIRPTVAIVTAIGLSQTAKGIRSLADVAKWKSKIFDGLGGRAVAVVGEHLPHLDLVMTEAQRHARDVFTYGESAKARLRILEVTPSLNGSAVVLDWQGRRLAFEVPALGRGMAMNAVGALACVLASDNDPDAALLRLQGWRDNAARLERFDLETDGGSFEVIDDSWNAEVISMVHALEVMASRPLSPGARRIAVLGRIVHLGEMSRSLHESLAEPVLASGADLVLTHGDEMLWLRDKLPSELLGPHFDDAGALATHLMKLARPRDTILVKGSRRDSDFGTVCPLLRQMAGGP